MGTWFDMHGFEKGLQSELVGARASVVHNRKLARTGSGFLVVEQASSGQQMSGFAHTPTLANGINDGNPQLQNTGEWGIHRFRCFVRRMTAASVDRVLCRATPGLRTTGSLQAVVLATGGGIRLAFRHGSGGTLVETSNTSVVIPVGDTRWTKIEGYFEMQHTNGVNATVNSEVTITDPDGNTETLTQSASELYQLTTTVTYSWLGWFNSGDSAHDDDGTWCYHMDDAAVKQDWAADYPGTDLPVEDRITGVPITGVGAETDFSGNWQSAFYHRVDSYSDTERLETTTQGARHTFTLETAARCGFSSIAAISLGVATNISGTVGAGHFTYGIILGGTTFDSYRVASTNASNERVYRAELMTLDEAAFDALEVGVEAPSGVTSLSFCRLWGVMVEVLHGGDAHPVWLSDGEGGFELTHVDYTGDGAATREITCGFRPHLVMIFGASGSNPFVKILDLPGNVAVNEDGLTGEAIARITDTGFTLATDGATPEANLSGAAYRALCIRDDGTSPAGQVLVTGGIHGVAGSQMPFAYDEAVVPDIFMLCHRSTGGSLSLGWQLPNLMASGEIVFPGVSALAVQTDGPTFGANGITSTGASTRINDANSRESIAFWGFRLSGDAAIQDIINCGVIDGSVVVPNTFPDIVLMSRQSTPSGTSTTFDVTLPTHRRPGHLAVIVLTKSLTDSVSTPSGWTAMGTAGNTGAGGTARIHVWGRILDGTEGNTVSLSAAVACVWHASVFLVTGFESTTFATNFASNVATGTTGNADPPSVTEDSDTNLYMALAAIHGNQAVTGFPTDYGLEQLGATILSAMGVGFAARQLNSSSENPGAFTNGSAPWRAHTLSVRGGLFRPYSLAPFPTRAVHMAWLRSLASVSLAGQSRWTDAAWFVDEDGQSFGTASKSDRGLVQLDTVDGSFTVATGNTGHVQDDADAIWVAFSQDAVIEPVPEAVDDEYGTDFGTELVVDAVLGVLANDEQNGGTALSAVLDSPPAFGTLNYFNADGSFSFTPAPGFSGEVTFTYYAENSTTPSNIATVTITVGESPAAVEPDVIIEMCFGGSYRNYFRSHPDIRALWMLSDTNFVTAEDEIFPNDAALYQNSPVKARGMLPEYGLATAFNGTDQSVLLDVDGISLGTDAPFSMVLLCRPHTVTSVAARCLFNTATNGGYLGLTTAGLFTFGKNGGTKVTGTVPVTAGTTYLVIGIYDGVNAELKVFTPDGEVKLFDTAGPTAISIGPHGGADAFIGKRNSEEFDGDIQGVALLGDDLSDDEIEDVLATTVWVDVSNDLRADTPIDCDRGFAADDPGTRVSKTGTCTFALNNAEDNHAGGLGAYSPGHANERPGFTRGIPVRVSFSYVDHSASQFLGRLKNIKPTTNENGDRLTHCVAVDWMDEAAKFALKALPISTDIRVDEALMLLLDLMPNKPHELNIQNGTDTLPTVFDSNRDENNTSQTEFVRLAKTELGLIYVTGDGTFSFENRGSRSGDADPVFTIDNEMVSGDPDSSTDQIINKVRTTVHPKEVDAAATTVLFDTGDKPIAIDNGSSPEMFLGYRDPAQRAQRVSGLDVVTPAPTTHYTLNTAEDGSGANVTGNPSIVLTFEVGSNGIYLTVQNGFGQRVYLTMQVLGKGVYDFQPVTSLAQDLASIEDNGAQPFDLDMTYQPSVPIGDAAAQRILNAYGTAATRMKSISMKLRGSLNLSDACINGEISNRVQVDERQSAVSAEFHIIGIRQSWSKDKDITTTWRLTLADTSTYWTFDVSQFDISTRFGF